MKPKIYVAHFRTFRQIDEFERRIATETFICDENTTIGEIADWVKFCNPEILKVDVTITEADISESFQSKNNTL